MLACLAMANLEQNSKLPKAPAGPSRNQIDGTVASPLSRLRRYAAGHRSTVWLATWCSILNKIFDLAPPLLIGTAVDIVVQQEASMLGRWGLVDPRHQVLVLALATLLIWILESLFEYWQKVLWRNLAQTVQHELRVDTYSHLQGLELSFFEDQSTGGLMSVLSDDVNQLERFLDGGANEVLQVSTTVIVIGAVFFWLAPSVAWMSFLPIPFILWGSFAFQKHIAPRYAQVRGRVGDLNSLLANNLGGISTIQSFVREDDERTRVAAASSAYREANREAIRLSSAFSPLIRIIILLGFTATLIFGGFLALDGQLAVGAYSVMIFLTQRLLWPLTRLGETFDLYQRAMASTDRVLDLLDRPTGLANGSLRLDSSKLEGEIRFDDVCFAYPGREATLVDLNLEFVSGSTTAIVGATGAGKTTIIKLLLRFYDVSEGSVRLDGGDVGQLELRDLRQAIGLVSQDVFLFHGTVRENIAYGHPGASLEEIVEAAQAAEAHSFIEALPQGYDTVVGERGQKLSGGQRQRLSIARAVLKDPPILVLDEATSAVDNETEAAIQRSLARIAVGRTTVVIAHRLSTIRHADRIYVLDAGRLVETGRHEDLIVQEGLYASLWSVQTGAALA